MSIRLNLRHRHRLDGRPVLANTCRTGCTCTIAHAVTPEAVARVKDEIALALLNGETDLVGYLQERLNTSKCPAVIAQIEVR